jgi:hypothetical protein
VKTTLLLDDEVHRQAKQASAQLGIPLTRFIEEAIRLRISTDAARRAEPVRNLPVCNSKGDLQPEQTGTLRLLAHVNLSQLHVLQSPVLT